MYLPVQSDPFSLAVCVSVSFIPTVSGEAGPELQPTALAASRLHSPSDLPPGAAAGPQPDAARRLLLPEKLWQPEEAGPELQPHPNDRHQGFPQPLSTAPPALGGKQAEHAQRRAAEPPAEPGGSPARPQQHLSDRGRSSGPSPRSDPAGPPRKSAAAHQVQDLPEAADHQHPPADVPQPLDLRLRPAARLW